MATDLKSDTDGLGLGEINKYDFRNAEKYIFKSRKGLDAEIVHQISDMKNEPQWMRDFRLHSLEIFNSKPMPRWGGDIAIDFQDIFYYIKPSDHQGRSWDDVPDDIKRTFDKLGIPEAEKKFLAGVKAQYESEVVYGSLREDLSRQGVIFTDTDSAVREYPDLVREYFSKIIPPTDNKFAALNSAVWSGGSFIYVPKGVKIEFPLQAYFRINAESMGAVRADADHRRRRRRRFTTSRGAPPRCTRPKACIRPWSRSSSRSMPAAAIPRSRTGRTTFITSSPSVPWLMRTPRWNGSMATSAAG